jgi:hypothetical protein
MAEEEKKQSKGQRRYAHGNKIVEKAGKPNEKKETPDKGGSDKAAKDTQGTPTSDTDVKESSPGSAPKADVMAGTDGIDIQSRHAGEREEMSARHAKAVHQLHMAHAKEHEAMIKRHAGDMRTSDILAAQGSGGSPAPDAGAGT